MILPNSKRLKLPFVAARLLFAELASALPVYFEHTGMGDACRSPLSSPLLAMKCLKQGSWLRSVWKAFPFGPQFACALGAPTHTHIHTCSRPLMLTDLTNQPSRRWERRGGQRGGRATWTVSLRPFRAPRAVASTWTGPVFLFIQSVQEQERRKKSTSTASFLMNHSVLFIGTKTTMWSRDASRLGWKSLCYEWVILIAILNFLRTSVENRWWVCEVFLSFLILGLTRPSICQNRLSWVWASG